MHVYLDLPMHRVEHYNVFVICLNIKKQGLSKLSYSYFVKFEVCCVAIFLFYNSRCCTVLYHAHLFFLWEFAVFSLILMYQMWRKVVFTIKSTMFFLLHLFLLGIYLEDKCWYQYPLLFVLWSYIIKNISMTSLHAKSGSDISA